MTALDETALLADLERLVQAESKTGDYAALANCASVLIEIGDRLLAPHASGKTLDTDEGPIVRWTFGPSSPQVAMVGHYDTVFPTGVLKTFPFTIDGDVVRGPGTFDMKAGILTALYGCAEALRRNPRSLDGATLFCNPDEEDGSKASRAHLQALVDDGLSAALVFEGGSENGDVCSSRMGGMWIKVTFTGKSAHGSQPHLGANALTAATRYLTQLESVADELPESTIVPTVLNAGDAINTVPASSSLTIDTRSATPESQQAVFDALSSIDLGMTGIQTRVTVLHRFAPMPHSASARLIEVMRNTCAAANLPIPGASLNMGITDANHLSAMGIEVLDGLGPRGGDEHSQGEWMSHSSMIERIQLASWLVPNVLGYGASLK